VLREERGLLYGRGVADMKTQCLMMMVVLRRLIAEGDHNDFWILFSEDEEIGSPNGAKQVISYLCGQSMQPHIVFVPDGGHDFAFVEKEKGKLRFTVTMPGVAAHASRPFLGENAIEKMMAFYRELQGQFPNPRDEADWVNSVAVTRIASGQAYNQIPDRCQAGFDLRLTEDYRVEDLMEQIENAAEPFGAEVKFHEADMATHYPREGPVARKFIDILRRVSGREPPILHANGASNGRFYLANDPNIHVLMSNPTVVGLHSDDECLVAASLEPYYQLMLDAALLQF
jgi:succinyl-diaminopimelate desuccinylase